MFRRVLILGDGTAGAENQARALWKRLGSQIVGRTTNGIPEVVRILPKNRLFKKIPPAIHIALWKCLCSVPLVGCIRTFLWLGYSIKDVENALLHSTDEYPDLVIGCGRLTAPINTFIKCNAPPNIKTYNIQIQHPRVSPKYFDRVITPKHDITDNALFGPEIAENVHTIPGSLHAIDINWIHEGRQQWQHHNKCLSENKNDDIVAVNSIIIGGQHKNCKYNADDVKEIIYRFIKECKLHKNNYKTVLYIICSRRTSQNILKMLDIIEIDVELPIQIKIWRDSKLDGMHNPYQMALSTSDKILVTSDSISMMTECLAIHNLKKQNNETSIMYIAFRNKVHGKHARFLVENQQYFAEI
jgi:mitochondrial fission protein ELM1